MLVVLKGYCNALELGLTVLAAPDLGKIVKTVSNQQQGRVATSAHGVTALAFYLQVGA